MCNNFEGRIQEWIPLRYGEPPLAKNVLIKGSGVKKYKTTYAYLYKSMSGNIWMAECRDSAVPYTIPLNKVSHWMIVD